MGLEDRPHGPPGQGLLEEAILAIASRPRAAVHCRLMRAACLAVALLLAAASPGAPQPSQIVISQPAEATTMDPGRSTQVLTVNYFFNLYDTLTRWDTGLKLVPGLASSWNSVHAHTWDFALRPGVKFHDGAPLTAEDVKATIERNTIPGRTIVH